MVRTGTGKGKMGFVWARACRHASGCANQAKQSKDGAIFLRLLTVPGFQYTSASTPLYVSCGNTIRFPRRALYGSDQLPSSRM